MPNRLSINHYSIRQWDLSQLIEGCRDLGIKSIGLWRDKINAVDLEKTRQLLQESGIEVSSLCRGGFFPYSSDQERIETIADNQRAVDEAAAIGSPLLVLVCGGIAPAGLDRSREMVREGIAGLTPYAQARGVKLGIEPLHPMFTANRSVIATLEQANTLANEFPSDTVGVVIDAYHVWWDPNVYREIDRAGSRIFAFHISDWLVPPPDFLNGRGLMGDGSIEFGKLTAAVNHAGYDGPIEVEIFNEQLWSLPGNEALSLIKKRFIEFIP
ncbi:MAG: sugar phosphate isomerase/epimerase [Verrucomicrobia bacterium]|nr:sugar phosphate isomerase/epimerase [Verrucomicrobiota bacterium]